MQNSGGFCQGRDHGTAEPLEMLTQGLDDGSLLAGGGLLFIEELPAALQDMLTAWLADGADSELPPPLKTAVQAQDIRMQPKTPFKDLLLKAKEKGIHVYGCDGGDATPGVDKTHGGQPERRDVKMNSFAKDVIDRAKVKHPNLPVIASVGEAHMNHHEGGIPGIAQILGLPGVTTGPGGKLAPVPDDPALRVMPSKAEQAFIDAYIDALEADIPAGAKDKLDDKDAFKTDIYKNAKELAARLAAEGSLTDVGSAQRLASSDVAKDQREEYVALIRAWPTRATDPGKVAAIAVRAGSPAFLDQMVNDHPGVLTAKDGDQRTLMHWAAATNRPEMIDSLAAKGALLDSKDKDGNQPLHLTVKRRRDKPDPRAAFQGQAAKALIANGADVDASGEGGRTAMHFAALNNNTAVLGELGAGNARTDKPDGRGWTAYDTAVGSTKVEAERWFYGQGQTNAPGITPDSAPLDTVQALMKSIRCENPGKHQQKVEDALRELYANEDLRPALDLLAKNSLLPRDADGGGGVKIFIADRDNVGLLYNSVSGKGPAGAYDENAHVVHVAGEGPRDFAGELCHELTHAATRVAFDTKTDLPFTDDEEKAEYLQAIENDVKAMSLLMDGSPQEMAIKEVISGRMATTVRDYPNQADLKLMQEFAVSVPQLIAEYGSDEVEKLAPGLMRFYRSNFSGACKTAANDPKYAFVDAKLDNSGLVQTATKRKPAEPTWLATGKDTVGAAVSMIRQSYKAMNGKPQNLPNGVTIPYLTENYGLDPLDEKAFEVRMQQIDKAMRRTIKDEGWPPEVSADTLRAMAVELGEEIRSGKPVKDLVAAVQDRVKMAVRQSKVDYVGHCDKEGKQVSDRALAEATIISAENKAWLGGGVGDGSDLLAIEVDAGKHKAMINDLTKTLGTSGGKAKAKGGMSVVTTLSKALSGDKTKGFYLKTDKRGNKSTSHVSISKSEAKSKWLEQLRAA